jgi:hypothetical protein
VVHVGELALERGADQLQLGVRLPHRHARLQPAAEHQPRRQPRPQHARVAARRREVHRRNRHPDLRLQHRRPLEPLRRHACDDERVAVEQHRLPDDRRVAAESPLP